MKSQGSASPGAPSRERAGADGLLWAAVALAFSPVAVDLVRHAAESPWARYALLFPVLFVVSARRGEPGVPRPDGVVWIAAGLVLELVAAFAGSIRWARPGLALAVFGMCRRGGHGSGRAQLLIFLMIPIPALLALFGSRELRTLLTPLAAGLWQGLGVDVALEGGALWPSGAAAGVRPPRELLALVPLLAGLAWYDAVLQRTPLARALATCLALALLAIPIEALALCLGVGVAAAVGSRAGQVLVTHGPVLAVALAGIAIAEWRWRHRRGER